MAKEEPQGTAQPHVYRADMGEGIPTQRIKTASEASADNTADDINATDAARTLADENEINLRDIEGSGVDGRVTVEDVRAAIAGRDGE